tara:strand:- start:2829 stop:3473 length:645 start_codon:yes stop_codon:yes gene_type:complete
MHKILICIPAFKEKKSLLNILDKLYKKNKVLVSDDCSEDGTKKINLRNVTIKSNSKNLGYEKNLLNAFRFIQSSKYDYVLTFDADGEHDVRDLKKFFLYIKKFQPDLIIGNRKIKRRIFEKIISLLFFKIYKIKDPLSGFKAYKLSTLKKNLKFFSSKYFLVDIVKYYIKKNYMVKNIDINSVKIKNRKSRIGDNLKTFTKNLSILRIIFKGNR